MRSKQSRVRTKKKAGGAEQEVKEEPTKEENKIEENIIMENDKNDLGDEIKG